MQDLGSLEARRQTNEARPPVDMRGQLKALKLKQRQSKEMEQNQLAHAPTFVGRPPRNPMSRAYREEMAQLRKDKEVEAPQVLNPISRKSRGLLKPNNIVSNSLSRKQFETSPVRGARSPSKRSQFGGVVTQSTASLRSGASQATQNVAFKSRLASPTKLSTKFAQRNPSLENAGKENELKLPAIIKRNQNPSHQAPAKKKSKWQIQSEQFRKAMTKPGSQSKLQDAQPEGDYDDRKQCPHCRRRFNADPYERHLPICPSNKNRVTLKL